MLCIPGGEHFFRGQEADVAAQCADFIEATFRTELCAS
jgi:hypothetical protein